MNKQEKIKHYQEIIVEIIKKEPISFPDLHNSFMKKTGIKMSDRNLDIYIQQIKRGERVPRENILNIKGRYYIAPSVFNPAKHGIQSIAVLEKKLLELEIQMKMCKEELSRIRMGLTGFDC